ncbi:MAG: hypothetical protein AAES65_03065 [Candidatus Thiodiazotropha sp. (ex. Lucinoma kazani)]
MNLESELAKQSKLAEWINSNLSIPFHLEGENEILSHPVFDMVVENHAAILLLGTSKLYGSMFALLRVQFEGLIRGLWLRYAANEQDLNKYRSRDKIDYTFNQLVSFVEKAVNLKGKTFSKIKGNQWSIFNSFTHTGFQAIVRRVGAESTGFDIYDEDEVMIVLNYSGYFSVISAFQLACQSNDNELENEALKVTSEYIANKL